MGKSTPQAPTPPDPTALANAQGTANVNTALASAQLSHVNQNSPFGTVSYSTDYTNSPTIDGQQIPTYTQNVSLSPAQQGIYNTTLGIEQQALNTGQQALTGVQNTLATPFTLGNNLPALQSSVGAGSPLFGIANAGGIQSQVAPSGNVQSQLNLSGVPSTPLTADQFAAQGNATTNAALSRFNQDWDQQQAATISRLNAQGIQQGSTQFDNAMRQLNQARNDAQSQAQLLGNQEQNTLFGQQLAANQNAYGQAVGSGQFANQAQGQQFSQNAAQLAAQNAAQAQLFGQNAAQQQAYNAAQGQQFGQRMQNASLSDQARQQAIQEQALQYSQPINTISALLGMGPGLQLPNAPNFGVNVAPTDVLGAYGLNQQEQQFNYGQQMQANNSLFGGLGNLAGSLGSAAILRFSDRRLKRDVRRLGATPGGIPLYEFEYLWGGGKRVGVMADEVRHIPGAVMRGPNGFDLVDYARIM